MIFFFLIRFTGRVAIELKAKASRYTGDGHAGVIKIELK